MAIASACIKQQREKTWLIQHLQATLYAKSLSMRSKRPPDCRTTTCVSGRKCVWIRWRANCQVCVKILLVEMRVTDCFERQDLSRTQLAHHELESEFIVTVVSSLQHLLRGEGLTRKTLPSSLSFFSWSLLRSTFSLSSSVRPVILSTPSTTLRLPPVSTLHITTYPVCLQIIPCSVQCGNAVLQQVVVQWGQYITHAVSLLFSAMRPFCE